MEINNETNLKNNLFSKWRKKILLVCFLVGLVFLVGHLLVWKLEIQRLMFGFSQKFYLVRMVLAPSVINFGALLFACVRCRSDAYSHAKKNNATAALVFIVAACMQLTYYFVGPMLVMPCIAVLLTVIFADSRLTRNVFLASAVTLTVSTMLCIIELRKGDDTLAGDVAAAYVVTGFSFFASYVMIRFEEEILANIRSGYKRQNQLIEEMKVDALTGLFNRKALIESIEAKIRLFAAQKTPMQMAVMDLDFFKKINDTYGHANGDEVLVALTKIIKDRVKGKASAFRYGGEEFVVLFQKQKLGEAVAIIEEIRIVFGMQTFPFMKADQFITVSTGIAEYERREWSSTDWFEKADAMLYIAKNEGRNRTVSYKDGIITRE
ncbi:MAG: GGDEF domain-containing protein [Oscillospiraceae bacterium]